MSQPLDYYAGYPNQQRMPKWVGVTLGSLFGGLLIVALAVAIRLVMPPRSAEASVAPKPEASAPVVAPSAPAPADPAVADDEPASPQPAAASPSSQGHHGKAKSGKHGKMSRYAKARPVKATPNPRYAKAAAYGKSVSSSKRDRKSRDDLDKLLGL
jgi:hypothetical protein